MKKICFVSYGNLYLAPYLKNYIDILGEDCDILVWNRHNMKEKYGMCNLYSFSYEVNDNTSRKISKLIGYIKFTLFVGRHLIRKEYDRIIFLQSIGGICNSILLLLKYRNKYIIDVRDYSIEGSHILRYIEKMVINSSLLNVISSEGYKKFLPNNVKYLLVHNYSPIPSLYLEEFHSRERKYSYPIRLSYIGLIRFQEQNKKIIDLFANDNRFVINFIGKNALELLEYIESKKIRNVKLKDCFPPEKTLEYYKETDAILNVYGNNTPLLDYALSNKLYYAAALHIPILVSKNTFMEKKAVEGGFGFTLDFDDEEIKDKLAIYMLNMDRDKFGKACDIFMKQVKQDNQVFSNEIRKNLS